MMNAVLNARWPEPHNLHLPVGLSPQWCRADFAATAMKLKQQLQQQKSRAVALWLTNPAQLACALWACNGASVTAILPADPTSYSIQLAEQECDFWLADGLLALTTKPVYPLPLTIAEAGFRVSWHIDLAQHIDLYTSGSSGLPVRVRKSWQQLWTEAEALAALPWPESVSAVWGSVSTQHLYGLSFRLMLPLFCGWPILSCPDFYPETVLAIAQQYPQSIGVFSPTLLHALMAGPADKKALADMQLLSAGGVLSDQVAEQVWQQFGQPVREIYGSTETGVMAWRTYPQTWQFLPAVQYETDTNDILSVSSPWSGGRQCSGDVIQPEKQGFSLLGRHDRLLKLADQRVSLCQLEQLLAAQAEVADVWCGIHPGYHRLGAWVALSDLGIQLYRQQGRLAVIRHFKHVLGTVLEKFSIPRFWRFEVALPRNSQGKLSATATEKLWQPRERSLNWQCTEQKDNQWQCVASVPLDLDYFSGHFAAFPLVPGVVELQWVMDAWQKIHHQPLTALQINNLKFQHFLRPADVVTLTLQWQPESRKLQFQLRNQQAVCTSGRIVMSGEI